MVTLYIANSTLQLILKTFSKMEYVSALDFESRLGRAYGRIALSLSLSLCIFPSVRLSVCLSVSVSVSMSVSVSLSLCISLSLSAGSTRFCSGSEAGSYSRLIDFSLNSRLERNKEEEEDPLLLEDEEGGVEKFGDGPNVSGWARLGREQKSFM